MKNFLLFEAPSKTFSQSSPNLSPLRCIAGTSSPHISNATISLLLNDAQGALLIPILDHFHPLWICPNQATARPSAIIPEEFGSQVKVIVPCTSLVHQQLSMIITRQAGTDYQSLRNYHHTLFNCLVELLSSVSVQHIELAY